MEKPDLNIDCQLTMPNPQNSQI